MKIAHFSDLHIGYSATNRLTDEKVNIREHDGYEAFNDIIQQVIDNDVDAVVIAGDTFHSATPSIRSLIVAQDGFRKLAKAGIKVYSIAGNHDTNDIVGDIAASRVLHDEDRSLFSHAEPYVKYEIKPGVFLHMISHHMFSMQSETMNTVSPVKNAINILTTHGSCIDPILEMQLKTAQSPREVVIPDFLLKDNQWDCIMLGHIHERKFVGLDKETKEKYNNVPILYNGSLIRRGFSDKEGEFGRGWTLWTIDNNGAFSEQFFNTKQRAQFDLTVIDGNELGRKDITDVMVDNVSQAMEDFADFDLFTSPIVRQKFVNVSPAQKAQIQWPTIEKFKKNMLSWQTSFDFDKKTEESNSEVSSFKEMKSGNIVGNFDDWIKEDESVEIALKGFDTEKRQKAIVYGKEKISQAYNDSLVEEK